MNNSSNLTINSSNLANNSSNLTNNSSNLTNNFYHLTNNSSNLTNNFSHLTNNSSRLMNISSNLTNNSSHVTKNSCQPYTPSRKVVVISYLFPTFIPSWWWWCWGDPLGPPNDFQAFSKSYFRFRRVNKIKICLRQHFYMSDVYLF